MNRSFGFPYRQQFGSLQRARGAWNAVSAPKSLGHRSAFTTRAVAGAVIATAAVLAAMGELMPAQPLEPVQRDVALAASGTSDTAELAALLNSISINGPDDTTVPLGTSSLDNVLQYGFPELDPTLGQLFADVGLNDPTATDPTNGIDTTVVQLLNVLNLGDLTPINSLLATLPVGSGDPAITGETPLGTILADAVVELPGSSSSIPLGDVTVDDLLAEISVPSGDAPLSDATTISTLLVDYPSLATFQLPDLPILGGVLGSPDLSTLVTDLGIGGDTLGQLLDFNSSTDLGGLAQTAGLDDVTIDSLLADLGTENGVTLAGTSTLDQITDYFGVGSQTLAELLPGGSALTNASTVVDLLNDTALFGNIGSDTIDQLLGLTSTSAAEAVATMF